MMAGRRARREALGHHETAAISAAAEAQLIAARECGGEKHRVLERDVRGRHQQAEHLERLAQQLPARESGQYARGVRDGECRRLAG